MHTTNYVNTLITVADDCPAVRGVTPPAKPGKPTIASRAFDMIAPNPYRYTSDDVVFTIHADRADIDPADRAGAREDYFSTGRPCLRASDLGKKYGWGLHANQDGRIALYALGSAEYVVLSTVGRLPNDTRQPAEGRVTVLKAMRSSRC